MDDDLLEDPPTRAVPIDREAAGPSHERLGRVSVKVLSGVEAGRVLQAKVCRDGRLRGGRNETNDIVLRDDLVSGFHFTLQFEDAGVVLCDLGSTNGVFVHGIRVREAIIELDTVFHVGDTTLQLAAADKVRVPLSACDHFGEMYGWSPVMRELFAELELVAEVQSSMLPVLITGETGSGKELVARGLHDRSARAKRPFVVLDCTAIPRDLADAIVFGHTRGAFTGATGEHAGVFEQADGGTLFIDELGEMPLELQAKLLRVLDRGEVFRFNEQNRPRKVDVRTICATNRDLERMVAEGRFREDLYFRVLGKHIKLPNLREREGDVVFLAERFLRETCERIAAPPKQFTDAAREALRVATWPGNVRQLKKVVECATQLTRSARIDLRDLHIGPNSVTRRDGLDASPMLLLRWDEAQVEFQREYIKALMQRVGTRRGWISRAAELAGMDRSGYVKALKRLGLYRSAMEDATDGA